MNAVFKYNLSDDLFREQIIKMPKGAEILNVAIIDEIVRIWAVVNTDEPLVERRIMVHGTGHQMDANLCYLYIGTVIDAVDLVWHVFEVKEV